MMELWLILLFTLSCDWSAASHDEGNFKQTITGTCDAELTRLMLYHQNLYAQSKEELIKKDGTIRLLNMNADHNKDILNFVNESAVHAKQEYMTCAGKRDYYQQQVASLNSSLNICNGNLIASQAAVTCLKKQVEDYKKNLTVTAPRVSSCPAVQCPTADCTLDIERKAAAIDAVPLFHQAPDFEDTFTLNDKLYLTKKVQLTWFDALTYCRTRGMELAIIKDVTDQIAVADYFFTKGISSGVAIGGDKIGASSYKWLDGSDLEYVNWNTPCPNQLSTVNCAGFFAGKLNDYPCNTPRYFVCSAL